MNILQYSAPTGYKEFIVVAEIHYAQLLIGTLKMSSTIMIRLRNGMSIEQVYKNADSALKAYDTLMEMMLNEPRQWKP
jgi:hypothetical protein